jgi:hypothetical protein
VVLASDALEYATLTDVPNPDPEVRETSKLAGAVTVIFPGKPVRLKPIKS